jgi:hypothetical protein
VFDMGGFHAVETLVRGPIMKSEDLIAIEEALRALVLHDDAIFVPMPIAANEFSGKSNKTAKPSRPPRIGRISRSAIVATSSPKVLTLKFAKSMPPGKWAITSVSPADLLGLFTSALDQPDPPKIVLSEQLQKLAATYSNAQSGHPNYAIHLEFLRLIFWTVQNGGSAVCKTKFARAAIDKASEFPELLFKRLDADWREFGLSIDNADIGPWIPPVTAIVASRSANREKIPAIIRDLRDEWAMARAKVWGLVDELKSARGVSQAEAVLRELTEASKYFSMFQQDSSTRPLQILWEFFLAGFGGAAIGSLAGSPAAGTVTALVGQTIRTVQKSADLASILLGRGAFDLARRVRRETARIDLGALHAMLTKSEKKALNL